MCNFHIGQKVVYVGPDRGFDPNPGKTVHTIQGMRKGFCSCSGREVLIDVGIWKPGKSICKKCGTLSDELVFLKMAVNFRPLVSDYTEAEIESVNLDEVLEPLYEPA